MTEQERVRMAVRDAALEARQGRVLVNDLQRSENAYKANPKNEETALAYATDLRKGGLIEQAALVLKPFAIEKRQANADVLTEYAKIVLSTGNFAEAQLYAQEATLLNDSYAPAHHVLGIAMDAQGYHDDAERHLEKALTLLEPGDPLRPAVVNNLALVLAGQGDTDRAEALLSTVDQPLDPISAGTINANREFINAL